KGPGHAVRRVGADDVPAAGQPPASRPLRPAPYIDDIEFRNSVLLRVFSSFSISSSIDSTVDSGEKTLRRTQMRLSSGFSSSSSSLRVPDLLMSAHLYAPLARGCPICLTRSPVRDEARRAAEEPVSGYWAQARNQQT